MGFGVLELLAFAQFLGGLRMTAHSERLCDGFLVTVPLITLPGFDESVDGTIVPHIVFGPACLLPLAPPATFSRSSALSAWGFADLSIARHPFPILGFAKCRGRPRPQARRGERTTMRGERTITEERGCLSGGCSLREKTRLFRTAPH